MKSVHLVAGSSQQQREKFATILRHPDPMATMTVKRCMAALFAGVLGLTLGACGSNFVADSWPHFAGGEPSDVPPRPGSPGYKDFIAHGQPVEGAPAPSGAPQTAGATPEFAARQSGGAQPAPAAAPATAPVQKPISAPPPPSPTDQNVGQGGLY